MTLIVKKYIINTVLGLAIIAGLSLGSCTPEEKPHPKIYTGPFYLGEALDYLYFKPGSYWVYKNTVTNQIDTITQISIDTATKYVDTDVPSGHYYMTYTSISYRQYSSLHKSSITCGMHPPVAFEYGLSIGCRYFDDGFPAEFQLFSFPFVLNVDTTFHVSTSINFLGYKKDIKYGPRITDSAVHFLSRSTKIDLRSSVIQNEIGKGNNYWVKGIGRIRVDFTSWYPETKESWELVDYYIKP
jgi:hypothetical protein